MSRANNNIAPPSIEQLRNERNSIERFLKASNHFCSDLNQATESHLSMRLLVLESEIKRRVELSKNQKPKKWRAVVYRATAIEGQATPVNHIEYLSEADTMIEVLANVQAAYSSDAFESTGAEYLHLKIDPIFEE